MISIVPLIPRGWLYCNLSILFNRVSVLPLFQPGTLCGTHLKPELTGVSPEMGRHKNKRRKDEPKEEHPERATFYDEDDTPSFVVGSLHYTFPLGLEGPREVRRILSRAANGRPIGWIVMGDTDLKFIVPIGDEGSRLHRRVPRGVLSEESSMKCVPPKESPTKMEASSGPRSEEVDPSCALRLLGNEYGGPCSHVTIWRQPIPTCRVE